MASKGTLHWENDKVLTIGKIDRYSKVIAFAKWSVLVKNLQGQKHAKNVFWVTLELISLKTAIKKHLIFEEWQVSGAEREVLKVNAHVN